MPIDGPWSTAEEYSPEETQKITREGTLWHRICRDRIRATYDSVTKSVRLSSHATSIRLEAQFWEILAEIAEREGVAIPKFLNSLYEEALRIMATLQFRLAVACIVPGLSEESGRPMLPLSRCGNCIKRRTRPPRGQ